jgi:tripartite-type tricarboxylate transporter receptor subunit TctC
MTALRPKADMDQHGCDVRFVPIADITALGYNTGQVLSWPSITMKLPRRKFLFLAAGTAAARAFPPFALAGDYPTRPVRIIVPVPAGTGPDTIARLIGQGLSDRLSGQFIVDSRPGAGTNIGIEFVVRAPPDGYTLLLFTTSALTNATVYQNLNFNFIRDIAAVASIGRTRFVMVVTPSLPVKTVPEFIAYAKANPGKINMASIGIGSSPHIFGVLFQMMTGVNLIHVPYRGSYIPDLLSGQVQVYFGPTTSLIEYIRSGKLRALGVTTATRLEVLPDIPTIAEFVPGYEAAGWNGIGAPKNTSTDVIKKLNSAINAVVADPKSKVLFDNLGIEPVSMTPDEFEKLIAAETEKWAKVIKVAGIKAE